MSRVPSGSDRHVLLVHQRPDGLGGSQESMLAEAEGLVARGWRVSFVHGQDGGTSERVRALGGTALCAPELFAAHAGPATQLALRRLAAVLRAIRPTLAHVHLWSAPGLLALLVGRVPTVVTCHVPVCPNGARFQYGPGTLCERAVGAGCWTVGHRHRGCGHTADEVPYGAAPFLLGLVEAKRDLRLLARAGRVIAPSAWQRRMLVQDGVPDERIVVLAPAIPATPPRAMPAARRPVVLAAGRLVVLKGFDRLVRASARVAEEHELHVVGDGPAADGLRALASSLGIADRLRLPGALAPAALREAAAGAAVVVVPSVWPETFGMVGPEALLSGTPVIASSAGGTTDWALPEHGVLPVAPGDVGALAAAISATLRRTGGPAAGPGPSPEQVDRVRALVDPEEHLRSLVAIYDAVAAR